MENEKFLLLLATALNFKNFAAKKPVTKDNSLS